MSDKTAKQKITITHPDGAPMHFSESLYGFLINRKSNITPFLIGNWITTLADEELSRLQFLSEEFFAGGDSHNLDDILGVITAAVAAETKQDSIEITPEHVNAWSCSLMIAVTMESYQRCGYVEILTTLSIDPHAEASIRVTELGMKEGLNLTFH